MRNCSGPSKGAAMLNANKLIGTHDVLLITLDTLRYDVACDCLQRGVTPNLQAVIPDGRWLRRHSPGSFTYSAHHAFFAGFLPTPDSPGLHTRLFATAFPGSETTSQRTCVFNESNIVAGLAGRGYHTVCIGGVGFFNKLSPLGRVFPDMFAESHWSEDLGVTSPDSTENQVDLAESILETLDPEQRMMLFLNVSAIHQPNCIFLDGADDDSPAAQAAALAYADPHLGRLFEAMRRRGPSLCVICSDHGTLYGEDGRRGYRTGHPIVWTVPYAEFILPATEGPA